MLVSNEDEANLGDARLAERMTTRHRYPNARRERLELGVVVESPEDGRWCLCVLPLCDSVRLQSVVRVPFLPYESAVEPPFDLVLETGIPPEPRRARLLTKPHDLIHAAFAPDATAASILAEQSEEGHQFEDSEGRSWRLVCRLKFAHAQRIAQHLGAEFSRVGVNESEWLRLKSKRVR